MVGGLSAGSQAAITTVGAAAVQLQRRRSRPGCPHRWRCLTDGNEAARQKMIAETVQRSWSGIDDSDATACQRKAGRLNAMPYSSTNPALLISDGPGPVRRASGSTHRPANRPLFPPWILHRSWRKRPRPAGHRHAGRRCCAVRQPGHACHLRLPGRLPGNYDDSQLHPNNCRPGQHHASTGGLPLTTPRSARLPCNEESTYGIQQH